ncbi:hypothetical protein ABTZ46_29165, partial [Nocardioides sp. NPDC126508]
PYFPSAGAAFPADFLPRFWSGLSHFWIAAELMVTEGASVLIADLDGDAASNTAAETSRSEVGDRAVGIAVDVMDENQ